MMGSHSIRPARGWWVLLSALIVGSPTFFSKIVTAEDSVSNAQDAVGIEMIRIEAGEYLRGFDTQNGREHDFHLIHEFSNRQGFKWETPAHRVTLTRAFEISRTEVTVDQFRAFTEATNYVTDAERAGGSLGCFPDARDYTERFRKDVSVTWRAPGFQQSGTHPVVCVSWNDAKAFCRWLSESRGRTYRLPSEAEWERACRAGTLSWYSWGADPDEAYHYANVADGALESAQPGTTSFQRAVRLGATEGDGFVFTAPTATFRPNPCGLYDMHGNVWEWCEDRWNARSYETFFRDIPRSQWEKVVVTDPLFTGETPQHEYGDWKVMRGGGWTNAPASCRSSVRTFAEAADSAVYVGFRIAGTVDQGP